MSASTPVQHEEGGTASRNARPGRSPAPARLLHLEHVGKDYAKVETRGGQLRLVWDLLWGQGARHVFRALDDIGFTLERGASLGIVGENGAGKSTLLKIVAGVIAPTRGRVEVNGRVGALLELGSGFHPEYTGLANIELAAALLGLGPREIAAKREQIVDFADIGEHINEPIKHYSSGMVVRLGFAVATALRPEILITDEVLAVGDESFQKKCIAWIEEYLEDGGTLLLCSHSMYHIQKLCRDALWLRDGKAVSYGPAMEVTQAYLAFHEEKTAQARQPIGASQARAAGVYAIQALQITPSGLLAHGETLDVQGEIYTPDGRAPVVLVGIVRADGTPVYGVASDMEDAALKPLPGNRFAFGLTFPGLALLPGKYVVRAHALDPEGVRLFDNVEQSFVVSGDSREMGFVRLPHHWHPPA